MLVAGDAQAFSGAENGCLGGELIGALSDAVIVQPKLLSGAVAVQRFRPEEYPADKAHREKKDGHEGHHKGRFPTSACVFDTGVYCSDDDCEHDNEKN
jgi:hypothetical protein